ncbi:rRNA maturation RNase YbeY [Amphibacillus sp. MSJ-3]|uniref:rRNA maturation RNase YbeY n=1 Tax=Amphibacillus sp. MSJ-3 TaxID=2841505 RepID=UPI001C0EB981|nr:rRNA maturation RNase YbeY [Amphibacillus sp. MSJ-3]MBU5595166.1 rRNA maturation RNase YbeY [Amphibacillus sp. MSJ-3]
MLIDFFDETNSVNEEYINTVSDLINFAAKQEGIEDNAEISITFVDNQTIQELNRNYRQIDRPTDVISFALQEQGEGEVAILGEQIPPLTLGDIVISVEKVKEQATEYKHSLKREYSFLALHGFLHLLGYDHLNKKDEQIMFNKQEEILNAFGLSRE